MRPTATPRRDMSDHERRKTLNKRAAVACAARSAAEPLEGRVLMSATTVGPGDDAYVLEGSPTTTFGTTDPTALVVKNSPGGTARRSFLKFRLDALPAGAAVVGANLRLWGGETDTSTVVNVAGHSTTTNPTWSENTLTWNNQPGLAAGTPLDTETVNAVADRWYDWSVTPHVRAQRQAGAADVTLALFGVNSTTAAAVFDSKEVVNAPTRPQLVVTTLLAPTGLTAAAASPTQVTLNWSGPSDNETGFKVERSSDGGSTWGLLTTTAADATQHADATAAAGTAYQYRVRATASGPGVDSGATAAQSVTTPQPPPPPATLTLGSSADAHVRNGAHAARNFGAGGELEVRLDDAAADAWREAFLRFDLTGVASADQITSAKVRLFGRLSAAGSVDVGLFPPFDENWTENGVTWDNRPFSGTQWVGGPAGLKTLTGTVGGWYEFDATDYLKQRKAAGATTADLSAKATNPTAVHAIFASGEAAANRPQLVVAQTGTAAGPALHLLNSVDDSVIDPMTDGYTINLGQTGTRLNIRATPVGTAGSVVFKLDGTTVSNETYAPYSVGGDTDGAFNDWTPPLGTHTLQVTQYSAAGGTGTVQGSTTVSFTAVAANDPPQVTTGYPTGAVDAAGTGATLAVRATDDGGVENLTYAWTVTPPTGVTAPLVVPAGDGSGNDATVALAAAGEYTFVVAVTDASGQGPTPAPQPVVLVVGQRLRVVPDTAAVPAGGIQQFTAVDQFGASYTAAPVTWTLDDDADATDGSLDASGLYTAPGTAAGTDTVRATAGSATVTSAVAISAPTLAEPSALVAQPVADGSVRLHWADNASDEDGFVIERTPTPEDTTTWAEVGTAATDAATFTDPATGLTPGTLYFYRVKARLGAARSAPSNAASELSFVPASLAMSAGESVDEGEAGTVSLTVQGTHGLSTLTIDWGDGTGAVAASTTAGGAGHQYLNSGTYSVTAAGADVFGSPITCTPVTLTVRNVSPTAEFASTSSPVEGDPMELEAYPDDVAADVAKMTYSWSVTKGGAAADLQGASTNQKTLRFVPRDNGQYEVTLAVDDGDGGTVTTTGMIAVANAQRTVYVAAESYTAPASTAVDGTEAPPYQIQLSASADPNEEPVWSYQVDWGDGSETTTVDANTDGSPTEASHPNGRYAQGVKGYTITVTAYDGDVDAEWPDGSGPYVAKTAVNVGYANNFESGPQGFGGVATMHDQTPSNKQDPLDHFASPGRNASLTRDGLPAHSTVRGSFALYVLNEWDNPLPGTEPIKDRESDGSPDGFTLKVGGKVVPIAIRQSGQNRGTFDVFRPDTYGSSAQYDNVPASATGTGLSITHI